MKKQIFIQRNLRVVGLILCAMFAISIAAKAQASNAIIFAENGEKFQIILNGVLQNATPETNVKLTGLVAPNYKTRVMFENKALGYLDFNLYFMNPGTEVTWNIMKKKNGEYTNRFVSEVPLAQAPPPTPNQTTVVYTTTAPPEGTTTTTRQTTTTTTGTSDNVSMNIGMNAGGDGGNVSMNISGMDPNTSGTSTTTTTTTTTQSSTSTYSDPPPPATQVVYVTGYSGKIGCPVPMSSGDFQSFKSTVESKSFEDSKLTISKQVLQNNCLTSAQVREVMKMFSFEDTRLQFAKFAYGHTYDIGNYYKVNDAFQFESSIDDLNGYISGQ
jgi:hypothetical protein